MALEKNIKKIKKIKVKPKVKGGKKRPRVAKSFDTRPFYDWWRSFKRKQGRPPKKGDVQK